MYNQSNLVRDLLTCAIIFVALVLCVVGRARSITTTPDVVDGTIDAGATVEFEADLADDAFDPAGDPPDEHPVQSNTETVEAQDQDQEPVDESNLDQESGDASLSTGAQTDAVDAVVASEVDSIEKTVDSTADSRPVQQMSADQVEEALSAYRHWVHCGEIKIELDMTPLSADQVQHLVDFYVLRTDASRVRMNVDGSAGQLVDLPRGRLITDLLHRRHWPEHTRTIADNWLGQGPSEASIAIVLNAKSELLLYRVLVEAVGDEVPAPGSTVVVRIDPSESALHFTVASLKRNRSEQN